MKSLNWIYVIFLGILLSITTGFGIAAFYPEPQPPIFIYTPTRAPLPKSCYETPEAQKSAKCIELLNQQQQLSEDEVKLRQKQETEQSHYRNRVATYTRTAIFLGVAMGALFALAGLLMIKKSPLVANGLLLAGVLTAVLTRFLVMLASLGAQTTGTRSSDWLAIAEFVTLVVLSGAVTYFGKRLKG